MESSDSEGKYVDGGQSNSECNGGEVNGPGADREESRAKKRGILGVEPEVDNLLIKIDGVAPINGNKASGTTANSR